MQLYPHFGFAARHGIADNVLRLPIFRDWPVHKIDRHHADPFTELLELRDPAHMGKAIPIAAEAVVPLELFLGIDRQQCALAEAIREPGHLSRLRRIEEIGV
ncbi:hypothetical protein [Erythrobacter aureus]|uniref:hypothetical protein n=1 Tax=Erythrobacter aureus TaxID=2182384 RepID=UPI0013B423EB